MDDDIKMAYKQTLKFKFPRIDVMFAIKCYNTDGAGEYYPDSFVAPYYLTDIRATILITADDGIEGSDQGGRKKYLVTLGKKMDLVKKK